jgi:hypothetical protein
VRGIVEVFDVGAPDAEYVTNTAIRQLPDDVVDYPVLGRHRSPASYSYT